MMKSKVKYIQSLSHKKLRDQDRVFVAEGPKIINELLSAPGMELLELYAVKEWITGRHDLNPAKTEEVDLTTLERISFLTTPNQVLAIFRQPAAKDTMPDLSRQITLMADNIQDPGNLGSILRCADWFGIPDVVCSYDCADVFSPKTVQSTMGSISRVGVLYADLERILQAHPGTSVYAATLSGKDVRKMEKLTAGIILVGNESKGISHELLSRATHQITIPGKGGAESLNAAVAAGIILSHLVQ